MIPINAPQVSYREINAVIKVMKSGFLMHGLGAGLNVTKFERNFARSIEAKEGVAVNTGTAALHLALAAAGVGPSDEVILPSFTFVATAEVIVLLGAKPIFADIKPDTYTISVEDVKRKITSRTKAIMPVDLYGLPAETKQLREIADKHGLKIIEDAAQAHGATMEDKPVGRFADAACWSFYASKNMTTGEGGMLTTNDKEIAEKARIMRSHGEKTKYNSVMLGQNYHLPEIQAAIGCVQLARLPKFVSKRRENAHRLTKLLGKTHGLQLPAEPERTKSSWYLYTVALKQTNEKQRNKFVEELRRRGIGAEVYYVNPVHLMSYYRQFGKYELPVTEKVSRQVLSLPVHPGVTVNQTDFIAETVLGLLDKSSH